MLGGGGDRGDKKYARVGRWDFGWGPPSRGVVGLAAGALTLAAAFFRLPSSRFSCCCGFRLRLLRPSRLPGGSHFRLLTFGRRGLLN